MVANNQKVVKLDGVTGQRYPGYMAPDACDLYRIAVHPDGTIFADQQFCNSTHDSVIGIDPTTGTLKFQVPVPIAPGVTQGGAMDLIIAGDGYAYLTYDTGWNTDFIIPDPENYYERFALLRVSSSGTSDNLNLYAFSFDAGGNLGWVVPNIYPVMATADGGFIGHTSGSLQGLTFDQNGNATGETGTLPVQSWTGNLYQYGSTDQFIGIATLLGASFWGKAGGMYSPGVAIVRDSSGEIAGGAPRRSVMIATPKLPPQLRKKLVRLEARLF